LRQQLLFEQEPHRMRGAALGLQRVEHLGEMRSRGILLPEEMQRAAEDAMADQEIDRILRALREVQHALGRRPRLLVTPDIEMQAPDSPQRAQLQRGVIERFSKREALPQHLAGLSGAAVAVEQRKSERHMQLRAKTDADVQIRL